MSVDLDRLATIIGPPGPHHFPPEISLSLASALIAFANHAGEGELSTAIREVARKIAEKALGALSTTKVAGA